MAVGANQPLDGQTVRRAELSPSSVTRDIGRATVVAGVENSIHVTSPLDLSDLAPASVSS